MSVRFSVSESLCESVCVLGLWVLRGTVREVFELLLVDLSDDGLIGGRQHGVLLGEVLVKVIHISFGLLQRHTHTYRGERCQGKKFRYSPVH